MTIPPTDARGPHRRGGVVIVESALLMGFFLMFLFGVLEYSRYLMALHVATNAARDGARYASVNVNKPTDFDYRPATVGGTTYPSIWQYTVDRMGGTDKMIANLTVTTFPCSDDALYSTTNLQVTVKPPPSTTPTTYPYVAPTIAQYNSQAAITGSTPRVYWNSASFTERIAVRISGQYNPILPTFLFMSGVANFQITMLCGSEG